MGYTTIPRGQSWIQKGEGEQVLDRFNRNINYLRISVTDRCNLRCLYCMPAEGVRLLRHEDILSYDEITAVTREAVTMGITRVRVTGGEPLARKGVTALIAMMAGIDGITDLSMTTNGTMLAEHAEGPCSSRADESEH